MRVLAAAVSLLSLVACPPASTSSGAPVAERPTRACTKEGDNCEYSPGKIGLCTSKSEGCDGGPCFSCMSLH
jgi:hypothetical protein